MTPTSVVDDGSSSAPVELSLVERTVVSCCATVLPGTKITFVPQQDLVLLQIIFHAQHTWNVPEAVDTRTPLQHPILHKIVTQINLRDN